MFMMYSLSLSGLVHADPLHLGAPGSAIAMVLPR